MDITSLPRATTCRLIDFERVDLLPGPSDDTYIVVVSGQKPSMNMDVRLSPLIYLTDPGIDLPDYWGIEVVGCTGGITVPALVPFVASLIVGGDRGTVGKGGIEIIGASEPRQIPLPPA